MFGMIPFTREENSLWNYLDNMEKSLFTGFGDMSQFRCDIQDKGDSYLLEAELPGFAKEDIQLNVKDGILTISAQHKESSEEKDKKGNYIRRERRYGSFTRSFDISGIQEHAITAAYNNGVLELELPKAQPEVPVARQIEIQ